MIRRYFRAVLFACCALSVSGCFESRAKAPKPTIVAFPPANKSDGTHREPRLVGSIEMVNNDGHFVLVNCTAWTPPAEGTALKCLRGSIETGIVNVGKERRGGYVTADIVTGSPQRGDQVYQ